MIGRLSAEALAAAHRRGDCRHGLLDLRFLTFGTTSLIGHHYGAKDSKACGETTFMRYFSPWSRPAHRMRRRDLRGALYASWAPTLRWRQAPITFALS